MATRLFLDFETRSRLDLTAVGTSRYARDPSTKALMLAWAFDDEPVEQVVFARGQRAPKRLRDALRDPQVIKSAWNAAFERQIFEHVLGLKIPYDQWQDTMVLAYTLSFPGKLSAVGDIIELPEDKKKSVRGKSLIRKFSSPRKPTKTKPWEWNDHTTDPDDWEEFESYNRGDVEAERAIYRRLRKWDLPEHEWALWHLDQRINDAGIPINLRVVHNAIRVADEVVKRRLDEMRELAWLDNPNSNAQLLPALQDLGYPFVDLKKGHISRALEYIDNPPEHWSEDARSRADTPVYRRLLELRQEVSKSSVKKYNALAEATDDDGMLRGAFQFAAAGRTWRWGGRKFQPQNLARPVSYLEKSQEDAVWHLEWLDTEAIEWLYPKPMDLLSTCVRPVVQAPKGYRLIDADLNAIENRVLGWMAGEDRILDVFRNNLDPYIDFAVHMYGGTYEAFWHEYKVLGKKEKRTIAKPGVLGCGYMLGPGKTFENEQTGEIEANGLLGYAWNMGVRMTPEQSKHSVTVWRERYTKVVDFWYALDRATKRCIRTGRPQEVGPLVFDISGPFMRMRLPSGRYLHYCRPKIEMRRAPWGDMKETVTYEGLDDKNQWTRIGTHPGKITENGDQAIARDLLAHGMTLAAREGIDIRLHVHDQIVGLVPEKDAEAKLKVLQQCMSEAPPWARDLPLGSAGFVSRCFIKD